MALPSTPHETWLFVIVGTTGSGKTKLSLDLAEALDRNLQLRPEIVSADSMQLYKHVDILSAKATPQEQARVPHHLLSILELDDSSFHVGIYQEIAKARLDHLLQPPHVPIVVGGTNYYIESIIWDDKYDFKLSIGELDPVKKAELEQMDGQALHALLASVDPERATLLHPNARRKVLRSLEIFYATNQPHSKLIQEQQAKAKMAHTNTCFFWVSCDKPTLDERLDKRVDDMVEAGLKEELRRAIKYYEDQNKKPIDWERGAFQSIGLREFRPWIERIRTGDGKEDEALFEEAVEQVKVHSRQYARSQISWIKNSLCSSSLIYKLDSTDPKKWYDKVYVPASEIACKLMRGEAMQDVKAEVSRRWSEHVDILDSAESEDKPTEEKAWKKFECEFCHRTLNGENEWNAHVKSKAHKAARKRHFKPNPHRPSTKDTTMEANIASNSEPQAQPSDTSAKNS